MCVHIFIYMDVHYLSTSSIIIYLSRSPATCFSHLIVHNIHLSKLKCKSDLFFCSRIITCDQMDASVYSTILFLWMSRLFQVFAITNTIAINILVCMSSCTGTLIFTGLIPGSKIAESKDMRF